VDTGWHAFGPDPGDMVTVRGLQLQVDVDPGVVWRVGYRPDPWAWTPFAAEGRREVTDSRDLEREQKQFTSSTEEGFAEQGQRRASPVVEQDDPHRVDPGVEGPAGELVARRGRG